MGLTTGDKCVEAWRGRASPEVLVGVQEVLDGWNLTDKSEKNLELRMFSGKSVDNITTLATNLHTWLTAFIANKIT